MAVSLSAIVPSISLLVGLGNPGREYENTRHNVGFMALDRLAAREGFAWYFKSRYDALLADGQANLPHGAQKFFLQKPQTFMNLSGRAVAPFAKDKGVSRRGIVVIHDELDLPFGKIKAAFDRGPAGHNGVRSLIECLGGQDFYRIRVGVGHPIRQSDADTSHHRVKSHVLAAFSSDEKKQLDAILDSVVDAALASLSSPWERVSEALARI